MILKPELVLCLKYWVHDLPLTLELSLLGQRNTCPKHSVLGRLPAQMWMERQAFSFWSPGPVLTRVNPFLRKHLSHWMVQAIALIYLSQGLRARSTSGLATLWALFPAVNLRDVCAVTSSPLSGFICWVSLLHARHGGSLQF